MDIDVHEQRGHGLKFEHGQSNHGLERTWTANKLSMQGSVKCELDCFLTRILTFRSFKRMLQLHLTFLSSNRMT